MELANVCVRACHVLKTMTEGRGTENLSGPSKKGIEELGRCVNPTQPYLLTVTSDIRVVHHIESVVDECANCAHDLREHRLKSTKECLIARRAEIGEILRFFGVCGFQLTILPPADRLFNVGNVSVTH